MSETWDAYVGEVGNYIRDLVNEGPQSVESFIQRGEPASLTGQLGQSVYRANCQKWASGSYEAGSRNYNFYGDVCKGYLEDIGEWPGSDGAETPFDGGQCDSVTYLVTASGVNTCLGGTSSQAAVDGPVQGLQVVAQPGATACDGSPAYRLRLIGKNGAFVGIGPSLMKQGEASTWSIVSTTRLDGNPDTCGDPFPVPKPAPRVPPPPSGPYIPPSPPGEGPGDPSPSPTIDVPIEITIDPDGTINFDVNGEVGEIAPVFGGGGGSGGPQEPSVGEPQDNPDGEGGGDEDFPEPPEGEEWVGAYVHLYDVPEDYGTIARSAPNTVYPQVVGNASLYGDERRYTANQLRSEWSSHFVEIERLKVEGVRVTTLPGIKYRVYPVSLPVEGEEDG